MRRLPNFLMLEKYYSDLFFEFVLCHLVHTFAFYFPNPLNENPRFATGHGLLFPAIKCPTVQWGCIIPGITHCILDHSPDPTPPYKLDIYDVAEVGYLKEVILMRLFIVCHCCVEYSLDFPLA